MSLSSITIDDYTSKEFDNDKEFEEFIMKSFSEHEYTIIEERTYKHDNPNEDEYCFTRFYENMPNQSYYYKDSSEQCKYPKHPNLSKAESLAFSFMQLSENNFVRLNHWNVSNIIDFTGCFYEAEYFDSKIIRHWNVSNGLYFDYMFCEVKDGLFDDFNGFKYLKHWDCSNGLSYEGMFQVDDDKYDLINYEAISHMKVNPNADFNSMFSCKISKEDTEYFRSWFPDMDIEKIRRKII